MFISQSPSRREMELSPSFCTGEAGCVRGLFRGLNPDLKIQLPAPGAHQACQGYWEGVGAGTEAPFLFVGRGTQRPKAMAHILAPGRLLSLPSLPTLISQLGPHISKPAFSLTGKGAALAAWLRKPDCLTYIPHHRGAEPHPAPGARALGTHRPAGVHRSPESILLPTSRAPQHSQCL